MQKRRNEKAISDIRNYGGILATLDPDIADSLVGIIIDAMDVGSADSIIPDLESAIEFGQAMASEELGVGFTAAGAFVSDGGFIGLQDELYYRGQDSAVELLTGRGADEEIAGGFYYQLVVHCGSFLSEHQNKLYSAGAIAEEAWKEIQEEAEEKGEEEVFFNTSTIATETARELMDIFGDLLREKGGVLAYQALANRLSDLVNDLK